MRISRPIRRVQVAEPARARAAAPAARPVATAGPRPAAAPAGQGLQALARALGGVEPSLKRALQRLEKAKAKPPAPPRREAPAVDDPSPTPGASRDAPGFDGAALLAGLGDAAGRLLSAEDDPAAAADALAALPAVAPLAEEGGVEALRDGLAAAADAARTARARAAREDGARRVGAVVFAERLARDLVEDAASGAPAAAIAAHFAAPRADAPISNDDAASVRRRLARSVARSGAVELSRALGAALWPERPAEGAALADLAAAEATRRTRRAARRAAGALARAAQEAANDAFDRGRPDLAQPAMDAIWTEADRPDAPRPTLAGAARTRLADLYARARADPAAAALLDREAPWRAAAAPEILETPQRAAVRDTLILEDPDENAV